MEIGGGDEATEAHLGHGSDRHGTFGRAGNQAFLLGYKFQGIEPLAQVGVFFFETFEPSGIRGLGLQAGSRGHHDSTQTEFGYEGSEGLVFWFHVFLDATAIHGSERRSSTANAAGGGMAEIGR